jgi:hypothetical protein
MLTLNWDVDPAYLSAVLGAGLSAGWLVVAVTPLPLRADCTTEVYRVVFLAVDSQDNRSLGPLEGATEVR